jgi:hypothetical protein
VQRNRLIGLVFGIALGGLVIGALLVMVVRRENSRSIAGPRANMPIIQGYKITNPTLIGGPRETGLQAVGFVLAWKTATFPGVYLCTFRAQDSSGSEVGSFSDEMVSLAPMRTDARVSIPVSAPPTSASGSCDDQRLDIGGEYAYEFSNLQVAPEPGVPSGIHAVRVSFDSSWLGTGHPGVVSCVRKFYDSGGNLVHVTTPFAFFDADGTLTNESVVIAAEEFGHGMPATVDMNCSPFQV